MFQLERISRNECIIMLVNSTVVCMHISRSLKQVVILVDEVQHSKQVNDFTAINNSIGLV